MGFHCRGDIHVVRRLTRRVIQTVPRLCGEPCALPGSQAHRPHAPLRQPHGQLDGAVEHEDQLLTRLGRVPCHGLTTLQQDGARANPSRLARHQAAWTRKRAESRRRLERHYDPCRGGWLMTCAR